MSKKILILATSYLPHVGGAEIAVKEITDRIDDCQFDMITARLDRKIARVEKVGNIRVYRMGFGFSHFDKYWYLFFGIFKAIHLQLKNRYDIVWSIMLSYNGFVWMFNLLFPKVKFVLTMQEGDPIRYILNLKRVRILKPFFKLVFKQADYIQAISNYLGNWARTMGVKCPVGIIPNGVDLDVFRKKDNYPVELKNKLDISKEDKVILTVSRLVIKNGVADIIKALADLDDSYVLIVVGDGKERKKLENLTSKLSLRDRVKFIGWVDNDKLYGYYAIADVFVRPSLSEGFGNVFVEAMAMKVPVIGTPIGGITDFIRNEETGLLCQPNNPVDVAEKIRKIINDEELKKAIIENGYELVKEKYNWNVIAPQIENIFHNL